MAKLKTGFGELEVEYIYENSLGYHVVTGEGFNQRTWFLSKARYDKLKEEMEAE